MKLLLALLLTSSILYSQNDSINKYTLPELNITQLEKGKLVTYGFVNDENIFLVKDSMLVADPVKYKYMVPLAGITKLAFRDGTYSWRGARTMGLVGGGLGLITGVLVALIYHPNFAEYTLTVSGFITAGILVGGFAGGILGSAIPYFKEYSGFSDDTQAKKEILKRIFRKHNIK